LFAKKIGTLAFALIVFACGSDTICPGDPAILSFTADTTTVAAGGTMDITVLVENFELSGHTEMADSTGGACIMGHMHIYLDDLMSNPLLMPKTEMSTITIPVGTTAGAHTLIARLHDSSHLIVEPQVTMDLPITVQ